VLDSFQVFKGLVEPETGTEPVKAGQSMLVSDVHKRQESIVQNSSEQIKLDIKVLRAADTVVAKQ
jgi:hypothetical protein